jgi:hypothetical protein
MVRKVNRVRTMVEDDHKILTALQISFVGEPLDWCWQRIQYLDEHSSPMWDLQDSQSNPFYRTLQEFSVLVSTPRSDSSLAPFFYHVTYERTAEQLDALVVEVRNLLFTMAAQVFWRLHLPYSGYPYLLAMLSHPSCTPELREQLAEQFFREPMCCLDAACSGKIRQMFGSYIDFLSDKRLQSTLRTWARQARLCNMHIERIFALLRKSCGQKVPHLERLVSAGLLSQVLTTHLSLGGKHPAIVTRSDLLDMECPTAAGAERPETVPGRARGHLVFTKDYSHKERRKVGRSLTWDEHVEAMRAGMAAWRALSEAEQEPWGERARVEVFRGS